METQISNSVTSTTAMQFKTEWKYKVEFALSELQYILFFNPNEENNYTNNYHKQMDKDKPQLDKDKPQSVDVIQNYLNFIQDKVDEKKNKQVKNMEMLTVKTLELFNYFSIDANARVKEYRNYLSKEKDFLKDLKLNKSVLLNDKFFDLNARESYEYLVKLQELATTHFKSYNEELKKRNAGPKIINNNFMNTTKETITKQTVEKPKSKFRNQSIINDDDEEEANVVIEATNNPVSNASIANETVNNASIANEMELNIISYNDAVNNELSLENNDQITFNPVASLNNASIANETELNIISCNEVTSLHNMHQIMSHPILSTEFENIMNQLADSENTNDNFNSEDNDETANMIMGAIEKLPSDILTIDEAMEQRRKFNEIADNLVMTQYRMNSTNEICSSMQTDFNRNQSLTSEDMDVHINSYLNINYITQLIKIKNYDSIKTYILLYIFTFVNKILDVEASFLIQFNQIKLVLKTLQQKLYNKITTACKKFFSDTTSFNNKTTNDDSQTLVSPKRKDAKRNPLFNETSKNKKVVKRLVDNITEVLDLVSEEYSKMDKDNQQSPFAITEKIKKKFQSSYKHYCGDTKKINDTLIFNLSEIALREAEKEQPLFPVIVNEKKGTKEVEKEKSINDILDEDSDEGRTTRKRKSTNDTILYEISYKNTSTSSKRKKRGKKETKTLKYVRSTVSTREDSVYCSERFSKGILFIDFNEDIENFIGENFNSIGNNNKSFIELLYEQFSLQDGQFFDSKFFSVVLDISPMITKKKQTISIVGKESIVFKNYLAFDSIDEASIVGSMVIKESFNFLDAFIKDDTENQYQLLDDLPLVDYDVGERILNRKKVSFYTFDDIISNFNRLANESPTVIFKEDKSYSLPIKNGFIGSEINDCFMKLLRNLIGNSLMNMKLVAIEKPQQEDETEFDEIEDSTINNNNNNGDDENRNEKQEVGVEMVENMKKNTTVVTVTINDTDDVESKITIFKQFLESNKEKGNRIVFEIL
jgi:hypothetical protein